MDASWLSETPILLGYCIESLRDQSILRSLPGHGLVDLEAFQAESVSEREAREWMLLHCTGKQEVMCVIIS